MFSSLKTTFYRCEVDTSQKNEYFVFRDSSIEQRFETSKRCLLMFGHFPKKDSLSYDLIICSFVDASISDHEGLSILLSIGAFLYPNNLPLKNLRNDHQYLPLL